MPELIGTSQMNRWFADRRKARRAVRWARYTTRFNKFKKFLPTIDECEVIVVAFGILLGIIFLFHVIDEIQNAPTIIKFKLS